MFTWRFLPEEGQFHDNSSTEMSAREGVSISREPIVFFPTKRKEFDMDTDWGESREGRR